MNTESGFFGSHQEEQWNSRDTEGTNEADGDTFADVLNGFTLDAGRRRRKRQDGRASSELITHSRHSAEADSDSAKPWIDDERQGQDGGFHPSERDANNPGDEAGRHGPDFAALQSSTETADVRPYTITGGRTKANHSLELETLISANHAPSSEAVRETVARSVEYRSIMEECQGPRSVVEIAAALRVPLGVARVLISDAADDGLVTVHKTLSGDDGAEAHFMLMERVLSGLRRL